MKGWRVCRSVKTQQTLSTKPDTKNTPYIPLKDLSENSVNMDLFPAASLLFDFNVISYNPKPQQMITKAF